MPLQATDLVVLVDEHDQEIGTMEKLQAHREGRLHRAVSVFLLNSKDEVLIQQRALSKYHSPGLWSNACCTHPAPGEAIHDAATRRLTEELGIRIPLYHAFSFRYKELVPPGLTEHEYDHVFFGTYDGEPIPQPEEVMAWDFVSWEDLDRRLKTSPDLFTPWFPHVFGEAARHFQAL